MALLRPSWPSCRRQRKIRVEARAARVSTQESGGLITLFLTKSTRETLAFLNLPSIRYNRWMCTCAFLLPFSSTENNILLQYRFIFPKKIIFATRHYKTEKFALSLGVLAVQACKPSSKVKTKQHRTANNCCSSSSQGNLSLGPKAS